MPRRRRLLALAADLLDRRSKDRRRLWEEGSTILALPVPFTLHSKEPHTGGEEEKTKITTQNTNPSVTVSMIRLDRRKPSFLNPS